MTERVLVLIVVFGAVLAGDYTALRSAARRDRIAYFCLIALSLYLCIEYITTIPLPNLNELLDLTLTGPAKRIVSFLES
ncbi:hypothetical protein [Paenibacillus sp. 1P07SE]|uniref:hypothetical protein n=1 Tax=Paenibacillus sp. 1P07SE TaxID=3132209 RepID=UPI0039A5E703